MGRHQRVRAKSRPIKPGDILENGLKDCCQDTIRVKKETLAAAGAQPSMEPLPCSKNSCRNIMWYSKTGRKWEWFATKRTYNV